MVGFNDVESIIHMDGDRFAVVEERDQTDPTDDDHEFDITIIEIDGSGDDIVKSQSEKTITVIDDLLTDGFDDEDNKGMEGLAYDPVTKYFYFAKEKGLLRRICGLISAMKTQAIAQKHVAAVETVCFLAVRN